MDTVELGRKSRRSVEGIGFPSEDGEYEIRFAPYHSLPATRASLQDGMIHTQGHRWAIPVWDALHPRDWWIALKKGE